MRLPLIVLTVVALAGCQPAVTTPPPVPGPSTAASPVAFDVPRMTPDDVQAAIARGEDLVLVDVRVDEAFKIERIAGAISAPWGELEAKQGTLPKDKLLVLYCT